MPTSRPLRTLAAACLVAVALAGILPGPAAALEPPRPLPGHRPAFVTETDTRPWIDCLWASAAMLLDKWTNGNVIRTHGELRRLSGDRRRGSSFEDLRVAFRKLGFRLELDADGDSTITWGQLLSRLRRGAGAVVLGDYSDLPRWYGRWDHRFWRKSGKKDNHAVYVERYDRRRGRVWIMDPLARGGWRGEWISIGALRRFAWFSGGKVAAVTSPTAKAAPFTGVTAAHPQVGLSDEAITASWRLTAPRAWRWPGADVHVTMAPATDAIAAAILAAQADPRRTADTAPPAPSAGVTGRTLRITTALPQAPGAYVARLSLTDRRFGRMVVASRPVGLFVAGPRRATLRLHVRTALLNAGDGLRINLSVANSGEDSWADPVRPDSDLGDARARTTRVVATWIRLDAPESGDEHAGDGVADGRLTQVLDRVPLAPGRMERIRETLVVPEQTGRWALVVDVVDDVAGSFATLGSAPAVALFDVVAPRGIAPAE
jgi:hypothetical protein